MLIVYGRFQFFKVLKTKIDKKLKFKPNLILKVGPNKF